LPETGTIVVPKRALTPLRWLSESPPDALDRILDALKDETAKSPRELEQAVEAVAPGGLPDAGQEVVSMLFGLLSLHFTHDWALEDIADQVAKKATLNVGDAARGRLRAWLSSALSSKPVIRLAKAYDVATDHLHVFHTARILTDIRPVFGSASNVEPLGAVITHQLKLDYFERSGHGEIYVALDDADLDELEAVVRRARQKGEALRTFLKSAGLPDMNITFD
jgi:hypothetical protein